MAETQRSAATRGAAWGGKHERAAASPRLSALLSCQSSLSASPQIAQTATMLPQLCAADPHAFELVWGLLADPSRRAVGLGPRQRGAVA